MAYLQAILAKYTKSIFGNTASLSLVKFWHQYEIKNSSVRFSSELRHKTKNIYFSFYNYKQNLIDHTNNNLANGSQKRQLFMILFKTTLQLQHSCLWFLFKITRHQFLTWNSINWFCAVEYNWVLKDRRVDELNNGRNLLEPRVKK